MKLPFAFIFGVLPAVSLAAIGDRCDPGGLTEGTPTNTYGVCAEVSTCKAKGGTTSNNNCPNDPAGVKCCYIDNCGPWKDGDCQWTQDGVCTKYKGTFLKSYCPGPNNFQCCVQNHNGKRFVE